MSPVYANGRSIVHKGDGQTQTTALPDVCKTPSPGGPIPVPYVNIAQDSDLAQGAQSVRIEGNAVALSSSSLSTSSGDEPGTAGGGLISSKTKGKLAWASSSIDVKIEGKGVVRFLDATTVNGNTYNASFITQGNPSRTGWAYGDDSSCTVCHKSKEDGAHRLYSTKDSETLAKALAEVLKNRWNEVDRKRTQLIAQQASERGSLQTRQRELTRALKTTKKDERGPIDQELDEIQEKFKSMQAEGATLNLRNLAMVGVLICTNGQKFAAISGDDNDMPALEFAKHAQGLGLEPCGRPASPRSMGGMDLTHRVHSNENREWNQCAAPKLLQKARSLGLTPQDMTEVVFRPDGRSYKTDSFSYSEYKDIPTDSGKVEKQLVTTEKKGMEISHGGIAPSCSVCQLNVPMLLCPQEPEQKESL